jgi:SAM-dependent methyltransferase
MSHVAAEHFEAKFADDADPWRFRSDPVERGRFTDILGCLPRPRYGSIFEPGCANGELTALLASRADRLLAMDASITAVAAAQERLAGLDHVTVLRGELPSSWPSGRFDLLVISEIAYYFDRRGVEELAALSTMALNPGGQVCLANWRGASEDMLSSGRVVRQVFLGRFPLRLASVERESYAIDVLGRVE